MPAGVKLLALAVGSVLLLVMRGIPVIAVGLVVVAAGYAAARVPWRVAWAQVRPLRWVALLVGVVQWWLTGPVAAVVSVGVLVVLVGAAGLVTVTTRTTDLLDVLVRALSPLRGVGVDPERVALVLALAIRSVPVLAATVHEVDEARRARGLERSWRALIVPVVVRSVRRAHLLGEALVARGVDD